METEIDYDYLLSKEEDERIMRKISQIVINNKEIESEERMQQRQAILEYVTNLLNQWIKECLKEKMFEESEINGVVGYIFPYGSYALGVSAFDSDMDLVCVVPGEITEEDYFSSFYTFLSQQDRIEDISAIPLAKVPLIGFKIDGINIDLPMVSLEQYPLNIPADFSIMDDKIIETLDSSSAFSLNGPRVTQYLLSRIKNQEEFKLLFASIRYIIKKRLCYKNMFGYLGGINIAIMLCYIQSKYTGSALYILKSFFHYYSNTLGTEIIHLQTVVPNSSETQSPLVILTPLQPIINSSRNITNSSLEHLKSQFQFVSNRITEIADCAYPVESLFEEFQYFKQFSIFIQIEASAENEKAFQDWSGFVESKLRLLTLFIQQKGITAIAYPKGIPNEEIPFSCFFYVALKYPSNMPLLDLSDCMNNFVDILRL